MIFFTECLLACADVLGPSPRHGLREHAQGHEDTIQGKHLSLLVESTTLGVLCDSCFTLGKHLSVLAESTTLCVLCDFCFTQGKHLSLLAESTTLCVLCDFCFTQGKHLSLLTESTTLCVLCDACFILSVVANTSFILCQLLVFFSQGNINSDRSELWKGVQSTCFRLKQDLVDFV